MAKIIQWFPGHMKKATRDMEEKRALCDGVICVLDARAPVATFNPRLIEIFKGRPVLYVLNKSDLADNKAEKFAAMIEKQGKPCVLLSAVNGSFRRALEKRLQLLTKEKRERAESKGITRRFRYVVAGIPNTGKSTIVNLLGGAKRAKTGDVAGVTRDVRWIKCADFDLLDTPGTMPPFCETQYLARHLAYIGSLNDDILDIADVAAQLLGELQEICPAALAERYGIETGKSAENMRENMQGNTQEGENAFTSAALLEAVCKRRGLILRGGEYDYDRAARAVIDDFRKGRLGKICLEYPERYENVRF
ncbi:MAG: ribosome biogenesis GTPase YlqF [Candidatus Borkfalkiaceae bacterium]|nr:ribosome biogenesis GTPase YlqF [Clostridia bacterium]MDY6222588.1 ribosome biogenesis GTPase YlqF [Christensenellaceae bacterium]